jgi:hypothetical protein
MKTSIATASLSGDLSEKLEAIATSAPWRIMTMSATGVARSSKEF